MKSRFTWIPVLLLLIMPLSGLVAQQKLVVKKTPFRHEFNALPYAYDALEKSIDKETMEIHYDRHHRAYFNNFMKAIEKTDLVYLTFEELFSRISQLPVAVRNNGGGHYNHQMFWSVLSPDGGGEPGGQVAEAINKSFDSFDNFKQAFEDAGATRFGSGWAWLSMNAQGELFVSSTPNQDNPLMDVVEERGTPILGLDVWEHAYYLRYQNKRASYMQAFWDIVNWKEVERRFEKAKKEL
ncbi:MAG: superoxide dismutase [Bacteroidales bacterium]|jgi:Fe-Mn family superoxide dismutase|nr:superoxide dismutase [Bacteroidales bacterium]MDY0368555.1 superoxide dismutase [Bacteroidales bacterium]